MFDNIFDYLSKILIVPLCLCFFILSLTICNINDSKKWIFLDLFIIAFYHETAAAVKIWGQMFPYLRSSILYAKILSSLFICKTFSAQNLSEEHFSFMCKFKREKLQSSGVFYKDNFFFCKIHKNVACLLKFFFVFFAILNLTHI